MGQDPTAGVELLFKCRGLDEWHLLVGFRARRREASAATSHPEVRAMQVSIRRSALLPRFFLCVCVCLSAGFLIAADRPPQRESRPPSPEDHGQTTIPGPLRPFLRMAAISQQVTPDEVLPLLARNAVIDGYRGALDKDPKPTEFLTLLKRYLQQAKELQSLAGPQGVISVTNCREADPVLAVIGYRLKQGCGPDSELEAADPDRAFIANDSGFPIVEFEQALRESKPFVYQYPSSPVPLIFKTEDWQPVEKPGSSAGGDFLSALLDDPVLARLYWALARMDTESREYLRRSPGLPKLVPFAALLDFYGAEISIHSGRIVVPGGSAAEAAWKQLVGASPDSPEEFLTKLWSRDEGWLAAYFDALCRMKQSQVAYFTDARRLPRFYAALRGNDPHPGPSKFLVFRPNPGLLLLVTRLQFEPNGEPLVPGNVQVWKEIVRRQPNSKVASQWARKAGGWNNSEQLVEGMFGLSRSLNTGPLQIFLTVSEIDRSRPRDQRLSPQTVRLLADKFAKFNDQYLIFSEFHDLDDQSIARFLSVAEGVDRIPDRTVRANGIGILQADIGLWQILMRQGQIPSANLNDSWQRLLAPFARATTPTQIFDAGRTSLAGIVHDAAGAATVSENELITLLAGPEQSTADGRQVRQLLANRMRAVMESQRLASLDTLFSLANGLTRLSEGKTTAQTLVPLANELREFEMPRPMFTNRERTAWAGGLYDNRQTELKTGRTLVQIIQSPRSPQEAAEARGQLAPFLRDTLVGLNYAYYEPPGAQMLHNNPLFVRYHDFAGLTVVSSDQAWHTPLLFGRGWAAGGGAHLVGSLADLPYVLAQTEQDFIVPENVQALVWEDLVPSLLTSAVLPRWWRVTPPELHAVTLYQRAGEELLTVAAENADVRQRVLDILSDRTLPQKQELIANELSAGATQQVLAQVTPAETFYLTAEFRRRFPNENSYWRASGRELESLLSRYPEDTSWERLSQDFGVPHPALAQTYARELLNVKPFPAIMGYSSRLMAESWESNNLYWARLTDELGYPPVMLNRLVPELTHRMIEKIFATHFEDWPAVLRAMRQTGEEFREGKVAPLPKSAVASGF
jgi:hypothetical protein